MATKKAGDVMFIPVEVTAGPFERERLVRFDSADGPVSGFVPLDQIIERDGVKCIEAIVVGANPATISIQLRGSFFTTTGLANVKAAA